MNLQYQWVKKYKIEQGIADFILNSVGVNFNLLINVI